jgi:DnaJ-class molecular chaperone
MYDLSVPNSEPGACAKCNGSGLYHWQKTVQDKPVVEQGQCNACRGTGQQTQADIYRNRAFNKHQLARMTAADFS